MPLAARHRSQEKVSADKLNEYLMEERTVPIVIDFYATWCGPCVILAQELERVRGPTRVLQISRICTPNRTRPYLYQYPYP